MFDSKKILFFSLTVFLLFASALVSTALAGKKGEPAPDFTLNTPEGVAVNLGDYQGKFVVLNFWATWCGPCKIEMPSLEALSRRFKAKNLEVVAISNDQFGATVVRPYVQAQNITFTVLLDQLLTVSNKYGVVGLPTTFLIDPQGNIIGVLEGAEDWSDPETLLFFENLLKPKLTFSRSPPG